MDAIANPLFPAPATEAELVAYIDGASRGNPGPASYAVVIQDARGKTLESMARFLGRATNNVAEWNALIAALEYAVNQHAGSLKIYCDSELVARQMQGRYRVQSPDLKPLFERARKLASRIGQFCIQHVPREQNRKADLLANQALDDAARGRPSGRNAETQTFAAVVEEGRLRPLAALPALEEGAEYEVRARKRTP